jgi:hypothetical protein
MSLDMNLGFRDTETAAVADGPTQERVGFGKRPVKLNLSVLSQHVNFLSLYISHAETIKDISRIFADREISETIVRKLGQPALESLRDSLRNISRSKYEDLAVEDRFFQKIRGLSTTYILGLRVSTSLKQYFSIFGFISRYGMKAYTPGVNETIKALRNREFNTLKQDVYRMSPFMRSRSDNLDLSINEAIQKSFLEKPIPFAFGVKPSQVRDSMFSFIRGMDFATTLPAWIGAFEEGKKRFDGDVDQAILFADKAIRTTQPSFRPMDLSPIQHSRKGAARAFTMFSTFTLLYGRMQRGLFKAWKQGQITSSEFFRMFTWENTVAPIAMTMFFATLRKEVPPPEEVLADLFSYNLMGIPFVKDLASVASAKFKGKRFAAEWDSPLFTPFDLAAKLTDFIVRLLRDLDNDKNWKNAVLTMAELFSFAIGVPAPRIARDTIRGMEQWERGEGTPFNILVPQTPSRK